jgi:hypothetical protein
MAANINIERGATTQNFGLWQVGASYGPVAAAATDTFDEISRLKRPDRRNRTIHDGAPVSRKAGLPVATGRGHDLTVSH